MADRKVSLVTGGAGFIGSNLCRKLLFDEKHKVICLDNLSTGRYVNIGDLLKNDNFSFQNGDVIDQHLFTHLDYIWHLACPASPSKYQLNGLQTLKTIVTGTTNMLELAVAHQARFLLTSTSEIYGDPEVSPQSETYWGHVNPVGPRSCYDEGKRCAETFVYETRKHHPDLQLKIVRIFNTYGPSMDLDDGRVITNFIKNANLGKPLQIYGNGCQTRSFCYVTDTIDGLVKMMYSQESGPINIGNPDTMVTINQLLEIFAKTYNSTLCLHHDPVALQHVNVALPVDDPKIRKPDITMAMTKLNWKPIVDLETGLALMIAGELHRSPVTPSLASGTTNHDPPRHSNRPSYLSSL